MDRHQRTIVGEAQRDGASDAPRSTRHQGDLFLQRFGHPILLQQLQH
jgi:hypothetical protein